MATRYFLGVKQFKETPAYAFVVRSLEPVKSDQLYYRARIALGKTPLVIFKLTNLILDKGIYQIRLKGDAQGSTGAMADVIIGFTGYKIEERSLLLKKNLPLP